MMREWNAASFGPIFSQLVRRTDLPKLAKPGGVAIELGVAEGYFSELILRETTFSHLYSVDMYAGDRGHDIDQYRKAIKRLSGYKSRNTLLKLRFDEALPLFEDGYFDFIYIDGYAHNGEENGQTLEDWLPKLRAGGILAGHDYDPRFPLVVKTVKDFVSRHNFDLHIVNDVSSDGWNFGCPSWFVVKPLRNLLISETS